MDTWNEKENTTRKFDTGAIRDNNQGKGRFDLIPPQALLREARHFQIGAEKYGERNWEQGQPINVLIDSAIRHLVKYIEGYNDEDHLAAARWNIGCAMHFEKHMPEMQTLPMRKNLPNKFSV